MHVNEHFLMLSNDYKTTSVGLFHNFELIDTHICDNKQASKQLFLFIDELLKRNSLILEKDCHFFAANQGPGPFTTLRVIIASINGLAFATKKTLIGVNNIETFAREYNDMTYDYIVALNNAFCDDVYYAVLTTSTHECVSGSLSFEKIIELINNLPASNIKIIGGIAQEKKLELMQRLHNNITIPEPCPENASLEALGKQAYQQWLDKENIAPQLVPLYLKQYTVKSSQT